jgi:poly(3-hydroxybutyrate) depolymerase
MMNRRILLMLAAVGVAVWGRMSWGAAPQEIVLTDREGKSAWLYTPARLDPDRTYWLVVGVHGLGGNGAGAAGLAGWAERGDVVVLGPTFDDGYQAGSGVHEEKLIALVAETAKHCKVHPRIFLHGFSAGAQFAHRFTFRNPGLVAGASVHSAGSWDEPNPAARDIPWSVSCGEKDTAKSHPAMPLNRIDGYRAFVEALREQKFDVTARSLPGVDHRETPQVSQMARACFEKARRNAAKTSAN